MAALAICSTAFVEVGRAQAKALGYRDLPIALIPHPFGLRTRDEIRQMARTCADDIATLLCKSEAHDAARPASDEPPQRAALVEAPAEPAELNRFFYERRWTDGLPALPPTAEAVAAMLRQTRRAPDEVIAVLPPAFGAGTVERIAINAALAGCYPKYMPILIAAIAAISAPQFNLQPIQTTTHPAAIWLIVNGPIARELEINGAGDCLGPGAWANATLGRALRLIQQNIGGSRSGATAHSTQGQPGKYTFCCAENEAENPWEPLHVERGFAPDSSTVTVVGAASPFSMNTHAKDAGDLLRVIADTMAFPAGSDYLYGGEPWLMLCPEHAHILKRDGLSKIEVKRRLWQLSKMEARRLAAKDYARTQNARRAELGEIGPDTLLPISTRPEDISIIVAGGAGTHSSYFPVFGNSRSVTREIIL